MDFGGTGWIRLGTGHAMTERGGFGFEVAMGGFRDLDGLASRDGGEHGGGIPVGVARAGFA